MITNITLNIANQTDNKFILIFFGSDALHMRYF